MNLLEMNRISKTYGVVKTAVHALKNVSFSVPKGGFVVAVGGFGSGKSTRLNMLGALDVPTFGKVMIDGKDRFSMKEKGILPCSAAGIICPVSCPADSRSIAQTADRILQVSDGKLTDLGRCGE